MCFIFTQLLKSNILNLEKGVSHRSSWLPLLFDPRDIIVSLEMTFNGMFDIFNPTDKMNYSLNFQTNFLICYKHQGKIVKYKII